MLILKAAVALFNLDTKICTECLFFVETHEAYQYLHNHIYNNSNDKINHFDTYSPCDNSLVTHSADESDTLVNSTKNDDSSMYITWNNGSSKQPTRINTNKNWGSATIYQIKDKCDVIPVSVYFPENYKFHGNNLMIKIEWDIIVWTISKNAKVMGI